MAETLATSCATSGVPMLFTDVLSIRHSYHLTDETYVSGRPSCGGSPGSWYAIMSACTISVKFLRSSRICSTEALETSKRGQTNRRTSIVSRTVQPLFLTSEYDELDVRAELYAEAFDCTRNGQKAYRSRAVVITARRPRAAKRASTVVVCADEDRLDGIFRRRIAATVYRRVIFSLRGQGARRKRNVGTYQMTFGANPSRKERNSQSAPVSSKRTFNHCAAMREPSENECRLWIPDLRSSPVRKRMSFRA